MEAINYISDGSVNKVTYPKPLATISMNLSTSIQEECLNSNIRTNNYFKNSFIKFPASRWMDYFPVYNKILFYAIKGFLNGYFKKVNPF